MLVLMAFGSLSLSLRQTGFLLGDDVTFTQNTLLKSAAGQKYIWLHPSTSQQYSPLTWTALWGEIAAFQPVSGDYNPVYPRLVGIGLHVVNALLLWLLLRKLELPGAGLAAAVFALHPVQVDAAVWVSQRHVLLATLFSLGALLVYLRQAGLNPEPEDEPRFWFTQLPRNRWALYAIATTFFVLALAAGPIALTLPIAVAAIVWWERGRLGFGDIVWMLPWAAMASVMAFVLFWTGTNPLPAGDFASGLLLGGQNIARAAVAWVTPTGLGVDSVVGTPAATAWGVAGWAIVVAALGAAWALRRKLGRGPLAGVVLVVLGLLPGAGWLPLLHLAHGARSDAMSYLSTAAAATAVAWTLVELTRRRDTELGGGDVRPTPAMLIGEALLLKCLLIFGGWHANDLRNVDSQLSKLVAANPSSARAVLYRVDAALKRNTPEARVEAERLCADALQRGVEPFEVLLKLAAVHESRRDVRGAMDAYNRALSLRPDEPRAVFGIAGLKAASNFDTEDAIRWFQRVIDNPATPAELRKNALNNLALLRSQRGETDEARHLYERIIAEDPRFAAARINFANMLFQLAVANPRQPDEALLKAAVDQLVEVLKQDPKNFVARLNAGSMLGTLGKLDMAEQFLRDAVFFQPDSPQALQNLAQVLMLQAQQTADEQPRMRRFNEAVYLLRRLADLDKDNPAYRRAVEDAERAARQGFRSPGGGRPASRPG
jgi:tetratricopeptide (TPR) repeat protein